MSYPNSAEENRRDHYRITDRAYLGYRRPDAQGGEAAISACRDFAGLHETMTELYQVDRDLARLLTAVSDREQPLSGALRLLNRKIEIMTRRMILQQAGLDDGKPLEVSLSAGGIAFLTADTLPEGLDVLLQALLGPDLLPIQATARVLDSAPCVGGFWTRFTFLDLPTEQQDRLARHILKAQQHSRRQQH